MKKITLLFIFIICAINTKAQIVFPVYGADWHYMIHNNGFSGPTFYTNQEIKYIKDTMITGRNVALFGDIDNFILPGTYSKTYVYTGNDTVYFFNAATQNQWQILYNFNCTAGQSWTVYLTDSTIYSNHTIDTITVFVDSVKYNTINGFSLKALYVEYSAPFLHTSVIYDKIGDINYLFNFTPRSWALCDGCSYYCGLLCYQDSTFALYQPDSTKDCNYHTSGIKQTSNNDYQILIYPNPANSVIQLTVSNEQIQEIKLCNVLGNEILQSKQSSIDVSNLPNGIYSIQVITAKSFGSQKVIVQH